MTTRAFISGCSGLELNEAERGFFRDADPWGLILFGRNVGSPDQIRALCAEFRAIVGRDDAPVLIDQEGGRVQRIRPPLALAHPAAAVYGRLHDADRDRSIEAARIGSELIAAELVALGITVDCTPVLDLPADGMTDAIGDRVFGSTVRSIAELGREVIAGMIAQGVLPVIKHIPGHGRATVDSHHKLPRVVADRETLERNDFEAFRRLADAPLAMTAHVVYEAIDADRPGTLSPIVIGDVIRGSIGFDGLLMTDDLSMKALSGSVGESAAAAIEAGCDIALHCNGDMSEMEQVAAATPGLAGRAAERAAQALGLIGRPGRGDVAALARERDRLLA